MKKLKAAELDSTFYSNAEITIPGIVPQIIDDIRQRGDESLRQYTREFDDCTLDTFQVAPEEIHAAWSSMDEELLIHLKKAADRIESFSRKQLGSFRSFEVEIEPGVLAGQRIIPIERAGCYVPGGRYPLVSSVLMSAIPARVAGVKEVALFSPPSKTGKISLPILAAAEIAGVTEVYAIGGAQAVAAMAFGTESIKPVCKVVGPGNIYVNAAKKLVYGQVGVDFIAGPTEILIIADESANPSFVAADLIAQAEHDVQARPILLTSSTDLADAVDEEIKNQLESLQTAETARHSLQENGVIILFKKVEEAVEITNRRAPEHCQLCVKNPELYEEKLMNYGSLFVGVLAPETLGDYSSGLNHILPTNGAAKYTGGLSVKDFLKIQTYLKVDQEGFKHIAPAAATMAHAEGLYGHEQAIRLREKNLPG
ncbi:histidinol dehydrogenase [Acidobacteriota bacterium]